MRQSRLMSLVEALANVVVGYALAVWVQVLVFPLFGLEATLRAEPRHWCDLHAGLARPGLPAAAGVRSRRADVGERPTLWDLRDLVL